MRAGTVLRIFLLLIVAFVVYLIFFENGKACDGLAANLPERHCFPGLFECNLEDNFQDASGSCQFVNLEQYLPSGKME